MVVSMRPHSCLVAATLAAVLPNAVGLHEYEFNCPQDMDPYTTEDNMFGWSLVPADWTWARPDCWNRTHLICGGLKQSPLDISLNLPQCDTPSPSGPDGALAKPGVVAYKSNVVPHNVHLDGYMGTATVVGNFGDITLQAGNGTVVYEAVQLHLATPSLHSIEGQYFDAELMVFHKVKGAANMLNNGVILSMLFKISDDAANASSKLFEEFGFSNNHSDHIALAPNWHLHDPVNLAAAVAPALTGASYSYDGSIPVPPCTETMKWTVLANPQHVGREQVRQLARHVEHHTGAGHRKAQRRDAHGPGPKCRDIAVNSIQVSDNHEFDTCDKARQENRGLRSARCWDLVDRCYNKRYSAVDIITGDARTVQMDGPNVHSGEKIIHYRAVDHVEVSASDYSLDTWVGLDDISQDDGHGNFGHLLLNGHIFFARSISVKPISQHHLDGKSFAGEFQIEHVLFGDTFGQSLPGYSRDLHKVMVSVFLKLGKENALLRDLEIIKNKNSIRDKVNYHLNGLNFDLNKLLAPAFAGKWYWYSSNSTRRGCGPSVRYMVFEEPLEVNLEQLNCLRLSVSGTESSQIAKPVPDKRIWLEHLPTEAVELNETDCGSLPQTDWKYGESHPHWDHGNERCWNTGYPICGNGKRQSPIDVPLTDLKVGDQGFLARCSWRPIRDLNVTNTGHNIQVNNDQMGYLTFIGPDGFPEYYHVVQFHLHMPSEHMIGGRQYAAELHIVHKRQIHVGNNAGDDLLVTGIMFDIAGENNTLLEQLFMPGAEGLQQQGLHYKKYLPDGMVVDEMDEQVQVSNPIDLMRAIGPVLEGPYYRYEGSLTTPPCSETVKWFVFGQPMKMSQSQWLSFKSLYPNPENNRPIQPLNGRVVAVNSFEETELAQYDFYLNRHTGRNRQFWEPSKQIILIPIIFTMLFATFVMASLFQRESKSLQADSAGGLEQGFGKPAYVHMK